MSQRVSPLSFLPLCAVLTLGLGMPSPGRAHDIPGEMRRAVNRLLTSLDVAQRQSVQVPFASETRQAWHYIPSSMMEAQGGRRGLEIKKLSAQQRLFAQGLLNTALSHHGQLQATTIMALETILHDLENGNPIRDSEMYHVAVYGTPAAEKTWGWSFEGHHLSVNLMLIDGTRFSVTPSFWGSNPAIVKTGPFRGLDTLEQEQKLGRELVRSLSDAQKEKAVLTAKAPREILSAAQRTVDKSAFLPPQGIPFDDLDKAQQEKLLQVVRQFVNKYRRPIKEQMTQRTPLVDGKGMYFAWAGGWEPGEAHYYRVQTPHFLFEYDNTQNDANHIHTVWRSFDGDFGADLLREHYENSPHHAGGKK